MIAIDTFMQPMPGFEDEAEENFIEFCSTTHPDIFEFFLDCVDQNLILNKFTLIVDGVRDNWRYYATDVAKAEVFQQKFQSMPLNFSKEKFSMQQFWNRHEFDISIDLSLVDLATEKHVVPLVSNDPKEMWSMTFPLIGPLDHYTELEKDLQAG